MSNDFRLATRHTMNGYRALRVGMGLAIVRSIVEAHGSKIDAENVSDGVARFYFSLPITKPPGRGSGGDVLSRGPDLLETAS
jgi:K+-sensing histidine kinase KdpD